MIIYFDNSGFAFQNHSLIVTGEELNIAFMIYVSRNYDPLSHDYNMYLTNTT